MTDFPPITRIGAEPISVEKKQQIDNLKTFLIGFVKYIETLGDNVLKDEKFVREIFLSGENIILMLEEYYAKKVKEQLRAKGIPETRIDAEKIKTLFDKWVFESEGYLEGIDKVEIEGKTFKFAKGNLGDLINIYVYYKFGINESEEGVDEISEGITKSSNSLTETRSNKIDFRRRKLDSRILSKRNNVAEVTEAPQGVEDKNATILEENRQLVLELSSLRTQTENDQKTIGELKNSLQNANQEINKKGDELSQLLLQQREVLSKIEGIESGELSTFVEAYLRNLAQLEGLKRRITNLENVSREDEVLFNQISEQNITLVNQVNSLRIENARVVGNLKSYLANALRQDLKRTLALQTSLEKMQSLAESLERTDLAVQEKEREIFRLEDKIKNYSVIYENDQKEIKRLEKLVEEMQTSVEEEKKKNTSLSGEVKTLTELLNDLRSKQEADKKREEEFRAKFALKKVSGKTFKTLDHGLSTFSPVRKASQTSHSEGKISRFEASKLRQQANQSFKEMHEEEDQKREEARRLQAEERQRLLKEREAQIETNEKVAKENERARLLEVEKKQEIREEKVAMESIDSYGVLFAFLSTSQKYKRDNLFVKIINRLNSYRESGDEDILEDVKNISENIYEVAKRIGRKNSLKDSLFLGIPNSRVLKANEGEILPPEKNATSKVLGNNNGNNGSSVFVDNSFQPETVKTPNADLTPRDYDAEIRAIQAMSPKRPIKDGEGSLGNMKSVASSGRDFRVRMGLEKTTAVSDGAGSGLQKSVTLEKEKTVEERKLELFNKLRKKVLLDTREDYKRKRSWFASLFGKEVAEYNYKKKLTSELYGKWPNVTSVRGQARSPEGQERIQVWTEAFFKTQKDIGIPKDSRLTEEEIKSFVKDNYVSLYEEHKGIVESYLGIEKKSYTDVINDMRIPFIGKNENGLSKKHEKLRNKFEKVLVATLGENYQDTQFANEKEMMDFVDRIIYGHSLRKSLAFLLMTGDKADETKVKLLKKHLAEKFGIEEEMLDEKIASGNLMLSDLFYALYESHIKDKTTIGLHRNLQQVQRRTNTGVVNQNQAAAAQPQIQQNQPQVQAVQVQDPQQQGQGQGQNPQNNPGWFGNFRTRARDVFMGARQRIGATANAIEAKVVKEKVLPNFPRPQLNNIVLEKPTFKPGRQVQPKDIDNHLAKVVKVFAKPFEAWIANQKITTQKTEQNIKNEFTQAFDTEFPVYDTNGVLNDVALVKFANAMRAKGLQFFRDGVNEINITPDNQNVVAQILGKAVLGLDPVTDFSQFAQILYRSTKDMLNQRIDKANSLGKTRQRGRYINNSKATVFAKKAGLSVLKSPFSGVKWVWNTQTSKDLRAEARAVARNKLDKVKDTIVPRNVTNPRFQNIQTVNDTALEFSGPNQGIKIGEVITHFNGLPNLRKNINSRGDLVELGPELIQLVAQISAYIQNNVNELPSNNSALPYLIALSTNLTNPPLFIFSVTENSFIINPRASLKLNKINQISRFANSPIDIAEYISRISLR